MSNVHKFIALARDASNKFQNASTPVFAFDCAYALCDLLEALDTSDLTAVALPSGWAIRANEDREGEWLHLKGPNGEVSFKVQHGTFRGRTLCEFREALAAIKEKNNE